MRNAFLHAFHKAPRPAIQMYRDPIAASGSGPAKKSDTYHWSTLLTPEYRALMELNMAARTGDGLSTFIETYFKLIVTGRVRVMERE